MMMRKMLLSGWGRQRWIETALVTTDDLPRSSRDASLSRGLGRAYGDAALPAARNAAVVMNTTLADRILSFDRQTGVLRAEAGLFAGRAHAPVHRLSPVLAGGAGHALRHTGRHGRRRHPRQEPPRRLRPRPPTCARWRCVPATAASTSAAHTEQRPFPGDHRRHGAYRPHPRGRADHGPDPAAAGLRGERALRHTRGRVQRAARRARRLAHDRRLDRHVGQRRARRARHRDERALGHGREECASARSCTRRNRARS